MKLALGLLVWFITEHVALIVGIVVFVATTLAISIYWPEQQ